MRLSTKEDFGNGFLTKDHKVLFNGKAHDNVVVADNMLGYIDVEFNFGDSNGIKRKFGSVVFNLKGKELRDKPLFTKDKK